MTITLNTTQLVSDWIKCIEIKVQELSVSIYHQFYELFTTRLCCSTRQVTHIEMQIMECWTPSILKYLMISTFGFDKPDKDLTTLSSPLFRVIILFQISQ